MPREPDESDASGTTRVIEADAEHARAGTVDLRLIPPLERLPLLEMTFAALPEGEDLRIVVGHDPQRLLSHLRERHGDVLAWEVVTDGPSVWVLRVRRVHCARGPPR